jgi:hypothetical protein
MNIQITGSRSAKIPLTASNSAGAFNVEVAGAANRAQLTELHNNMTHFNNYKYLEVPVTFVDQSSQHRQQAADRHASPRTRADVLAVLSDSSDPVLPVYRPNHTMYTLLFHSDGGVVQIWHGVNPEGGKVNPTWESTVAEIFSASVSPS